MSDQDKEINISIKAKNLIAGPLAEARERIALLSKDADRTTSSFNSLTTVASRLGPILAGAFTVHAIKSTINELVEFGGKLTDLSARTGIGRQALQAFKFAGDQVGVSLEAITSATAQLEKRLAGGDKSAVAALKFLGISFDELRAMRPEDQFSTVAAKLGDVADQTAFVKLGTDLMGKGFLETAPLIRAHLEDLVNEARRLGVVIAEETLDNLDDLGDRLTALGAVGTAVKADVLAPFIPLLTQLAEGAMGAAHWFGNAQIAFEQLLSIGARGIQWLADSRIQWLELTNVLGQNDAEIKAVRESSEWYGRVAADLGTTHTSLKNILVDVHDRQKVVNVDFDAGSAAAKKVADATEKYKASLRGIVDNLSGAGAIDKAHLYIQALGQTVDVSQMTREKQEELNKVVLDGIAAYNAIGTEAPAALHKVWEETERLLNQPKIGGLIGGMKGTPLPIGLEAPKIGGLISGVPFQALEAQFKTPILSGMKNLFAKDVPLSLIAALQGGGKPYEAVGATIGSHVGDNISKHISESLEKKAGSSIGTKIGGMVGNIVPIVGPIIGALGGKLIGAGIGKIKDLFTGGEGAKVNDMRDQFIEAAGGLDALNRKAHDAGTTLDKLLAAKKVKDFESAVNDLNGKMGDFANEQLQDQQDLEAAIQRYGFSIEELGPKMRQQKLDEQAQLIMNDFRLLAGSGIDVGVVIDKMGGSINEFIVNALRTGSEIPASMKPMLEKMIEMGTLTDDSGNKITSLEGSGLKFSETLTQGFEKIAKKFDQLLEGLGLLPNKIEAATSRGLEFKSVLAGLKDVDVNINARWNVEPPPDEIPGHAAGGLFNREHVARIAEGGQPEIVGSVEFMTQAVAGALQALGKMSGAGPDQSSLTAEMREGLNRLSNELRRSHQMLPNALLRAVRDGGLI